MDRSSLAAILLLCSISLNANESRWSDYPEHTRACLEAMNFHMGDEKIYAEVLGVQDIGKTDCRISAIFEFEENIFLFEQARIKKGLDPKNVRYKGHNIQIVKSIGKTRH